MALIKCGECGKEISDTTKVCIHCGCPTKQNISNTNKEKSFNLGITNKVIYTFIGIFIVIGIIIFIANNNENKNVVNNEIIDTNEIKMQCVYDAYNFKENINGSTTVFLDGNSQSVNIKVEEIRERAILDYNCNTLINDIYNKYNTKAICKTNSKQATNGVNYYNYKIEYNYLTNNDIGNETEKLKEQKYKCITYYNKDNSIVNSNIIGSWCGYDTISKYKIAYTFNEDGTAKYLYGNYINRDFYYEIDKDNNINYIAEKYYLNLSYNEIENTIKNGSNKLSKCENPFTY